MFSSKFKFTSVVWQILVSFAQNLVKNNAKISREFLVWRERSERARIFQADASIFVEYSQSYNRLSERSELISTSEASRNDSVSSLVQ